MAKKLETSFDRIYYVNHSHIDHTWWNSPDACRQRNEEIINRALEMCAKSEDFKFSYEITSALMGYLEKNPQRKEEVRKLLEARQLEVGGLFVSANDDACSEETIARNFYFGKRWLEDIFGYSPKIVKELDTPGHPLQMPQLVRDAGMEALLISRGPQGAFNWKGPDGSEILVYCVPYNWSYWRKLGIGLDETEKNLPAELKRAEERYIGPSLLIPDGDDMTLPNPALAGIVKAWNEKYDRPKLVLSTFEEFLGMTPRRRLPRRSGDMPNLWVVVHALQLESTRDMKLIQNLLPAVEVLHSIVCIHKVDFKRYPTEEINSCWKRALLIADHNWGGKDETRHGPEGDEYKRDLAQKSLRDCQKLIDDAFYGLAKHVLTNESSIGMSAIVFNPVAWERTDVVSVEVTCDMPGLGSIEIVDRRNEAVPFDVTTLEKHRDDTIRRARADFLCRDLPSLGYSTFYVKPMLKRKDSGPVIQDGKVIENEFYRVEVAEDGSRIESLYDKRLDLELAGRFNAVIGPLELELGMFELFGVGLRLTVPDQSFFENPANEGSGESVEPTGEMWRASDFPAAVKIERNGDLSNSVVVEGDFIESRRRQKIVLYKEIKRVDLHLELDWRGKSNAAVYLQMPNRLMNGEKFVDVPFAVHRDGNELADFWIDEKSPIRFKIRGMQDWVCFENEGRGLAIATRWPMVDFTTVPAFPLMWTNDSTGFFIGERYKQIGKHSFSFSLTSYNGTWLDNKIHLWGRQWSKPPLTFLGDMAPDEGRHSYLSVDANNVVVSAFKKAQNEDAIVVRLYEIAGRKTEAILHTSFPIKEAHATNIIETESKRLASDEHSAKLSFRPFEIKTIKLSL